MAYYQKVKAPGATTPNTDINLNLYALNSSAFPTSGGTYACSTSNSAPYDFTNGATNYYIGSSRIYSNYGGTYTLTTTVTNPSYLSSWKVNRTSSNERGATTGEIVNNSSSGTRLNIYKADTLSKSVTAAAPGYGDWNISSIASPTCRGTGTAGQLYIQNVTGYTATASYSTDNSSWTSAGSLSNGSSTTKNLSSSTTYYTRLAVTRSRPKYTYTASSSFSDNSATPKVAGDLTVTFIGSNTPSTETGTIYSYNSTKTGPHTITIDATSTGINKVFYNTNGSTIYYANTSSTATVSLCYGQVVYYYITYTSGYAPAIPSTAGTASSPHTKTVANGNMSVKPTARAGSSCTTIIEKCTNAVRRGGTCPSQGCLGNEGFN